LHIGGVVETEQILASELTTSDVDDGTQVKPLLEQIPGPLASLIGAGVYDQAGVNGAVATHYPEAEVIGSPRSTTVTATLPSDMAESAPTQRDRHLHSITEHGRLGWQTRSGYTRRASVEITISRLKQVIGNASRSRTDRRRMTEIALPFMPSRACLGLDARSPSASPEVGL